MPRSRYGSGSITQRGPTTWQLRITVGVDPVTGRQLRRARTVQAANKREATKLLMKFHAEANTTRTGMTLGALLQDYLEARPDMSPSTLPDYEGYIRRYVSDHLRRTKVRDLTPRHLDALYLHLRKEGGVGGRPLSPGTIKRLHGILHAALEQAVRWDLITSNPADRVNLPKAGPPKSKMPPAEDLVTLLTHIDGLKPDRPWQFGSPLPEYLAVLLGTGARPGELCAITWGNLADARLHVAASVARGKGGRVVKATKTGKDRLLILPASVQAILDERRAAWREVALGAGVPLETLSVFPTRNLEPWRPDSMSRLFRQVRDDLELDERLTLRNLRHYVQSVLIGGGVDVTTTAARGGHSPKVLLDVYSHMLDAGDQAAADVLDAHLTGLRGK